MGATIKESTNNLYLTVYDGAFRKWVKEPTETSKKRIKKNGKEVNEELFSMVTGNLKKIYVYEEIIEDANIMFLIMYMKDENDKEYTIIKTPFSQSFAQSFLMRLPNLDLTKPFTLKCFTIKNEEKTKEKGKEIYNDLLIPYVDNVKVNTFFTKEDKKDMPEIIIKRDKNNQVKNVDTIERDQFLVDFIIKINDYIKDFEKPLPF